MIHAMNVHEKVRLRNQQDIVYAVRLARFGDKTTFQKFMRKKT